MKLISSLFAASSDPSVAQTLAMNEELQKSMQAPIEIGIN
jgi:hypothetical protein